MNYETDALLYIESDGTDAVSRLTRNMLMDTHITVESLTDTIAKGILVFFKKVRAFITKVTKWIIGLFTQSTSANDADDKERDKNKKKLKKDAKKAKLIVNAKVAIPVKNNNVQPPPLTEIQNKAASVISKIASKAEDISASKASGVIKKAAAAIVAAGKPSKPLIQALISDIDKRADMVIKVFSTLDVKLGNSGSKQLAIAISKIITAFAKDSTRTTLNKYKTHEGVALYKSIDSIQHTVLIQALLKRIGATATFVETGKGFPLGIGSKLKTIGDVTYPKTKAVPTMLSDSGTDMIISSYVVGKKTREIRRRIMTSVKHAGAKDAIDFLERNKVLMDAKLNKITKGTSSDKISSVHAVSSTYMTYTKVLMDVVRLKTQLYGQLLKDLDNLDKLGRSLNKWSIANLF